MKKFYRREGLNNYWVMVSDNVYVKGYEVQMLINNNLEGLLEFNLQSYEGYMAYAYNINGKHSLQQLLRSETVNYDNIKGWLLDIYNMYREVEAYLINIDNISLKYEDIYISDSDGKAYFCYGYCGSGKAIDNLRNFVEGLLKYINSKDIMTMELIHSLYEKVSTGDFSVEDMAIYVGKDREKGCLEGRVEAEEKLVSKSLALGKAIESKGEHQYETEAEEDEGTIAEKKVPTYKLLYIGAIALNLLALIYIGINLASGHILSVYYKIAVVLIILLGITIYLYATSGASGRKKDEAELAMEEYIREENEREKSRGKQPNEVNQAAYSSKSEEIIIVGQEATTMLTDIEATTILNQAAIDIVKLVLEAVVGGVCYDAASDNVMIGSSKENDIVLSDAGVSRTHANMFFQLGNWYIVDCSSTNGTYINDCRVDEELAVMVTNKDVLSFGNVEYKIVKS